MNRLSLYIHIPFCVKKCHYCDFLSAPCKEETRQEYVETLCMEIVQRAKLYKDRIVDTIFFGGGTPSLLSAGQMGKIMDVIRQEFRVLPEAEISMEVNPGTVTKEKLEAYQKCGVNRLSIGLQSANNEELKVLGRIHTWEVFENTWKQVRDLGFSNVNIDLMSALPGQTLESYENTLRKVLALKPEHISAYSLIIEEGTQFYEWFGEDSSQLPDEITDRRMYEMTRTLLEEHGYYRYEISNYALEGYECKHNIGYWKRKEYLGLGLGAASLISNVRSSNVSELEEYLNLGRKINYKTLDSVEKKMLEQRIENGKNVENEKNINWLESIEELSIKDQMEEFMFLGLRMMEGVSVQEFETQFGKPLKEVYGTQIAKLESQGLLQYREETGRYALTLKGIDVSNQVFVEFIE
ncbi:MAG: radical SAM family heme chaperone HemW [Lachnospiraceae bacterium]|nr:radical SAM family heme chaperone HemW [Lachnospiraceae bacterium]